MATDNAVYQLTHTSLQSGVDVDNIYFYQRGTGITAGSEELVNEWIEQVLPTIQAARPNDITATFVEAHNLFDAADTFSVPMLDTGDYGSHDVLPPHDAVSFLLARQNSTTRNGGKRMAGIPENSQTDGILTDGTFLDLMADIADKFIAPILGTLAVEWYFPVIVGRILDGDVYRLPADLAEATVNGIIDCVFNPDVSTQTSRKFGNGA